MVLVVTHNFAKVKLRVRFSLPAPHKPDLYPYSGSVDAKTGWAALTGFVRFLTQKDLTPIQEDDAAGMVLRLALKTRFSEMGWGSTPPSSAKVYREWAGW